MHVREIQEWCPPLQINIGARTEFHTLGLVEYDTKEMCTYAVDSGFLEIAIRKKNVAVVFAHPEAAARYPSDKSYVCTPHPAEAFYDLHNALVENTDFYGKNSTSEIDPRARVHESAYVAGEGVIIGEGAIVGPRAVIQEGTVIERNVLIKSGAVIGADGMEHKKFGDRRVKAIHAGGVHIGENSEIGANSVIVRNVFNDHTRIGANVVIGNLVNVGHQCVVEDEAVVMPMALLCGSSTVRKGARIGPAAVVSNWVEVGRNAVVSIGSVVVKDVPDHQRVSGNFAVNHMRFLRTSQSR